MQGVIVSLICVAFTAQPTVASAYFMISVLTIQMYLCMYLIMFAAAWRLRRSHPERGGKFQVPGGKPGLALACGLGGLGCLLSIGLGFFPHSQLRESGIDPGAFTTFLAVGLLSALALPFLITRMQARRNA